MPVIIEAYDRPHAPTSETREQVMKMVACGLDLGQIAWVLKCRPHEVTANYPEELEHAIAVTNAQVGAALLKAATKGDVNAAKYWMQTRAKWIVPNKVEVTGKDGKPIEVDMKEKKSLMDEIVGMVGKGKVQEEQARTTAEVNRGANRVN